MGSTSMVFDNPLAFLGLMLLPFFIWRSLRGHPQTTHPLVHLWIKNPNQPETFVFLKRHTGLFLRCLIFIFLIIALARPQRILGERIDSSNALDMMIAIDTSGSMRALDFKLEGEVVDRLAALKSVLADFIRRRAADRLGLVVFGKDAYTQAPLTLDHKLLSQLIEQLYIGMAGDATAIGDAVATASQRLAKLEAASKIIVLMTDGQNTAGSVEPLLAAKAAAGLGIKVYTVGIGQDGKVPIPVDTPFGQRMGYLENSLDENLLRQIAAETGGQFFRAYNTENLKEIYSTIDKLETTKVEVKKYVEKEELFSSYVITALILTLILMVFYASRWRAL